MRKLDDPVSPGNLSLNQCECVGACACVGT